MKKMLFILCLLLVCVIVVGCGSTEKNIEGTLPEIMEKLYEGIADEEKPMALGNVELNSENFESYAFADIKYKEALASESMVGSIAHSVVLIRLENASDAKSVVVAIKEKVNPSKWLCVTAENTYVLSKGNLVVLIMANDLAPRIKENFEKLN